MFGLGIGPVPVALTWKGDDLSFAWMTQPQPTFGEPMAIRRGAAAALSLSPAAVAGTGLPVQVVSCGVPFLFVPLTTRSAVDNAASTAARSTTLLASTKSGGARRVPVFGASRASDRATVYSRMFAPEIGVAEDPATGIASGPLGCYLVRHKIVPPEKAGAMLSLQGVKMGRPSHVHIADRRSERRRDRERARRRRGGAGR